MSNQNNVPFTFNPDQGSNKQLGSQLNIDFKNIIDTLIPAGSMVMYGAATAPTGWLLCNGSAVSRTTYADLFTIISTTFGSGDGSTTFNIPDMRQKFPIGKAASGTGSTLGGTGGTIDHVHTSAPHTHTVPAHFHGMATGADLNITASGGHTHGLNGSGNKYCATDGSGTFPTLGSGSAGNITVTTADTNTHTHTSANFAGSIGLVTGGVNGDAQMTSGTTSPTDTGIANPPFVSVNFIIKY